VSTRPSDVVTIGVSPAADCQSTDVFGN